MLFREYYDEARNEYKNDSETFLLCNRGVCNWKSNSQTINACNWRIHRKYLMKAPNYTKKRARKPQCNLEINSQIIKYVCVIILGPTVLFRRGELTEFCGKLAEFCMRNR